MIPSTDVLDPPFLPIPHKVSCPVQPLSLLLPVSVRYEPLSRLSCSSHITPPQPVSSYVQLSHHSLRHHFSSLSQYIHPRVRYPSPYRYAPRSFPYFSYLIGARERRTFRRPIPVY